ncbi:hypothetical protein ESA94_19030 [Lacibacter luteus]|uniref:Uncharacterized protein n=1 Tax=Lacibacter luteus TaxID=2508719 RepID=A0A4Q1CEF6_9BACT|nr:DUF6804 family protein [Lacibacter luteus]RXK58106.1 hypothetical protein ESA94_19030 [Lacibacter luteus]
MKNNIFLLLDTVIKFAVAAALIIAAMTKQQYSYYNFLRWFVMIPFIYFCYKSFNQKQMGLFIYFGIVAILFNPFQKFWFQKQIWHIIDFLIVGITIVTIFYDWFLFVKAKSDRPKN